LEEAHDFVGKIKHVHTSVGVVDYGWYHGRLWTESREKKNDISKTESTKAEAVFEKY
jgi:hypothetical protein